MLKSLGSMPCLLGKNWGYDDGGVWVADGCGGEFIVTGSATSDPSEEKTNTTATPSAPVSTNNASGEKHEPSRFGSYTPDLGFKVANTEYGDMNIKLFTYVRYINLKALQPSYTNFFGVTTPVQQRQDFQVNKAIAYFLGWILNPKLRYLAYVWSTNVSQGLGAQVVVAGNLRYSFSDHFTLGVGINSLPGVRSLEGNFPYWLGVDDRTIGDEFFRPSYTTGIWGTGRIIKGLEYNVMLGNNLSQLGISAAQLSNRLGTVSTSLVWMPTTGEYGRFGGFGDFEDHQKPATRIGIHFTRSDENRQSQPNTDSFDNVQIRLSDGSIIFRPDLFGLGVTVTDLMYHMFDVDAGIKYRGFSFAAEYYKRWLNNFSGPGTSALAEVRDNGFQLQASAMVRPKLMQLYAAGSEVFGKFGTPWDAKVGVNVFPWETQVVRFNFEYIQLHRSPVGGSSLPYLVGATGPAFNANLVLKF